MLFGDLNNEFFEEQCALQPKALSDALHFLKKTDFLSHEPGRFEIELSGVPCILQVLDLETARRESLRPEIHRKYIDVQLLAVGGPENAAYYSDNGENVVEENLLNSPRDILFYENNPAVREGRICMEPGTFVCYFPWDVHVPAVQVGEQPAKIRKIVLKLPLEACLRDRKQEV